MSHSATKKINSSSKKDQQNKNQKNEEFIESSNENDETLKIPLQLKIEFVNSIMFRQWELAKKLCQFMLMYEPNNPEAKQYAPLIEFMLNKEESSSSSSSSSSSDSDSDSDDSSDSSSTSQSSIDEDQKENETTKSVNGSSSHQCETHHHHH